jgi:hypothetical protein
VQVTFVTDNDNDRSFPAYNSKEAVAENKTMKKSGIPMVTREFATLLEALFQKKLNLRLKVSSLKNLNVSKEIMQHDLLISKPNISGIFKGNNQLHH